ncbi:MAG TPA: hypothetical protein PLO52_00465 [Flavobacterium alvei]|nr:hypothetical protein [Flavobacterium alvei]
MDQNKEQEIKNRQEFIAQIDGMSQYMSHTMNLMRTFKRLHGEHEGQEIKSITRPILKAIEAMEDVYEMVGLQKIVNNLLIDQYKTMKAMETKSADVGAEEVIEKAAQQ